MLIYFFSFLATFFLSIILTLGIKKIAIEWQVVDYPDPTNFRKIHKTPIPLLGGIAIFMSFFIAIFYLAFVSGKIFFVDNVLGYAILPAHIWGIFIGGSFLMIGGFLDDKYNLKPSQQIIWPILSALVVIFSGIGIKFITNPLGGVIRLDGVNFQFLGIDILLFSAIFTFFWLLGLSYTTKLLDGLDGLASGISLIGTIVLFALSINIRQPQTALITMVLAGAIAGFLIFNFNPAKIFLGEGGSTFLGFMLAVLAIISGGKIATALLVMGIPIIDVFAVIISRILNKKSPFKHGDNRHLHFRLLDLGFSQKTVVLILYFLTAAFGITALYLQSWTKLITLGIMAAFIGILILIILSVKPKNNN